MYGTTAPARHGRRRHMVDNDDILFSMPMAGTALFRTYGREAVVDVGGATWVGGGEAGYQDTFADLRWIALGVPKSALRGAVKDLDSSICRTSPGRNSGVAHAAALREQDVGDRRHVRACGR